jgi:hypothetical protein
MQRALEQPYSDDESLAEWAVPPGDEQWNYRTFCGT